MLCNAFNNELINEHPEISFSCGIFVVISKMATGITERNLPRLGFIEPNLALNSSNNASHLVDDPSFTDSRGSEFHLRRKQPTQTAYSALPVDPDAGSLHSRFHTSSIRCGVGCGGGDSGGLPEVCGF